MKKIILILALLVCSTAFGSSVNVRDGRMSVNSKDDVSHIVPVDEIKAGYKRYNFPDLGATTNCSVTGTELGWCSGNLAHGVAESYAILKQMSDGTWMMYFHAYVVLTAAVTNWNFEINGIDIAQSGVLASYCASTGILVSPGQSDAHLEGGNNTGRTVCSAARAYRNVSGWITLEDMPTWAKVN